MSGFTPQAGAANTTQSVYARPAIRQLFKFGRVLKADSTTTLCRFQKEFTAFCVELQSNPKKKKKVEFIDRIKNNTSSPEAIEYELGKLVKSAKDRKLRRAYSHIQHVMEAIKDYTGVVDVMSMWKSHSCHVRSWLMLFASTSPGVSLPHIANMGRAEDRFRGECSWRRPLHKIDSILINR